ncbi:putative glycoprotein endopeptidase, M22 peptidase-like protein [Serratia symbiotica str. 'Cinara cedri']|nr:putative glycoprotein endopeptidase, M22 peptidase-like protein [Serratia symbiotica str. 'Cinara cedri']
MLYSHQRYVMSSTRILAIDTSTDACSVAIWNEGKIQTLSELRPREHTQLILPMVQQVLVDSGLLLNQLDVLAFSRGPGSFTGIRIGIGVAQGLALGVNLPILGISTLQIMAQGAWRVSRAERVLVAIDARMRELYWAQFERQKNGYWYELKGEMVLSYAQALDCVHGLYGDWTYVGTGWQKYPDLISESAVNIVDGQLLFPQAEDILPLALLAWQQGLALAVENAKPTYLRHSVAWKKLPGRL